MKHTTKWLAAIVALSLTGGYEPRAGGVPLQPPAADPAGKGPYEVGHASFLWADESRPGAPPFTARPIAVDLWYPADVAADSPQAIYVLDRLYRTWLTSTSADWEKYGLEAAYEEPSPSSAGPFPLVVFSPGWAGPAVFHIELATRLASHGIVVAVPTHFGDAIYGWYPGAGHVAVAAFERPRDVSFVITELLRRNSTPGDMLSGLLDPARIAAAGWSLGGYAAMALAGGDDSGCDGPSGGPPQTCGPTAPDQRISAILLLDGSNQLLHFYELARVGVPSLGIGREWDRLSGGFGPSWQARQHAAFSGRPAYRVDVADTNHQSFTNVCEAIRVLGEKGALTPAQVAARLKTFCTDVLESRVVNSIVNAYSVAFLQTHLAGSAGYQRMLTPGWALTRERHVEFFVTERRDAHSIDQDWPDLFVYFPHQPGSATAMAEKDPLARPQVEYVGFGSR